MANDSKDRKFNEHVKAIEEHKSMLDKLHLESDIDLAKAKSSLENIAITLEEYLKVIGVP
ncbi:MAG: hypothetical protein PSV17_05305 [Methylotenera sp.]|uniref:hypothetical protein n=1 Tax=Methylotenera sp. TaxID=2051956 RepID=UPI00248987E5|nr:hypothetical protein [Methylotenera sp.]MDI1308836.1 hypothetical protein [Methylotenera sp.]